ncbi:hypothetical protein CCY99_06320 [Helicobacter sp. 16-1353]|uniref:hypothetical protein n=1 Tax=Helicobacter sp. 16-1353 TaxID=2004996 RepID=UPI000DCBD20F|nr:hypothetical protein [Helicobacter sp. 16-1353]RAX53203.1 hypothetical protein CCY99_06320 [Helicobacter sp. 16-1353]
MQIILISIYIILELVEFWSVKNANNAYSYIYIFVEKFHKSKILFILNNLSFFYILFLIFALDINGFGVIVAGIFKFFDIATKLWFINKDYVLDELKIMLENFKMSFWVKFLNPLSYILLVSIGIILR